MMENYIKIEHNEYGDLHYLNSKNHLHRLDGPAVEYKTGAKFWLNNGKIHRLNGPAIFWANKDKQWYINGIEYKKFKHNRLVLFFTLEPQRIIINSTDTK